MTDMKDICRQNEIEYGNEVRNFRKSNLNGQKKKINAPSPKKLPKRVEVLEHKPKDLKPARKYMKKYFLIRRLNPRKKKEKVEDNNSDDKYFT